MITVLSVGPRPDQEGGTASVVAELVASPPGPASGVRLVVVDSGSRGSSWPRRIVLFLGCLVRVGLGPADLVHLHLATRGSTWRKMMVAAVCRLRGLPYGIHLHGGGYPAFLQACPAPVRRAIRRFFGRARYVVVLGESWVPVVRAGLGLPADRIRVVRNGVGCPSAIVPAPFAPGERPVVFLGRIERPKGVPDLLAAWAAVTDRRAELVLAGTPADAEVVELVRRSAADRSRRVRYVGAVSRAAALGLLAAAWAVVLPSYVEAFPMVPLEAMALGVPCIASRVGAVEEMLVDGVNALLVDPGDGEALAARLAAIVSDEALRNRLGRAARETWERSFSAARMVEELTAIWRSVVPLR